MGDVDVITEAVTMFGLCLLLQGLAPRLDTQPFSRFPRRCIPQCLTEIAPCSARDAPDANLFRKGLGQSAKLYFMGHALIENRQEDAGAT